MRFPPEFNEAEELGNARASGVRRFVAAGVVASGVKVLMLRRQADDFLPGIFELPSGQIETGESLTHALCREVAEETGLSVTEVMDYLGAFDYLSRNGQLTRQFSFLVKTSDGTVALSEHSEYRWVDLGELERINATADTKKIVSDALNRLR